MREWAWEKPCPGNRADIVYSKQAVFLAGSSVYVGLSTVYRPFLAGSSVYVGLSTV